MTKNRFFWFFKKFFRFCLQFLEIQISNFPLQRNLTFFSFYSTISAPRQTQNKTFLPFLIHACDIHLGQETSERKKNFFSATSGIFFLSLPQCQCVYMRQQTDNSWKRLMNIYINDNSVNIFTVISSACTSRRQTHAGIITFTSFHYGTANCRTLFFSLIIA